MGDSLFTPFGFITKHKIDRTWCFQHFLGECNVQNVPCQVEVKFCVAFSFKIQNSPFVLKICFLNYWKGNGFPPLSFKKREKDTLQAAFLARVSLHPAIEHYITLLALLVQLECLVSDQVSGFEFEQFGKKRRKDFTPVNQSERRVLPST